MRSLFTITVLFVAALGNAVASPHFSADTLAPRQQAGTLTYIPGAPPLTFNYTCTTPSPQNYINVWSAVNPEATTLSPLITTYVSDSAGTALVGGQYLALFVSAQDNNIAGPVTVDFGEMRQAGFIHLLRRHRVLGRRSAVYR
ncbi:hypothetical protein NHJ13051_009875 [Beauveria bassiana]